VARTVTIKIRAEMGDLRGKLRDAGSDLRAFRGELDRTARGGQLDAVADQAGAMGLALAGAGVAVLKLNADFERAMSGVKAATRATNRQLDLLRQAALKAGADTSYSATQAAQAITELSKAGVTTANILGGGLNGALSLAAAGQLDVAEAAETAASAMTQFGLKGADIPHIADLLAAAAGKAQGSVHDLGYALNQTGLVADQVGWSIEETTGVLASFASAGLLGSDAGTSLKTALQFLSAPTKEASDLMADLGIKVYDSTGKFQGAANIAQQLKTQLGGLSEAQRNQALRTIFGSDAIRAANILYKEGATGIQEWTKAVDAQGYAAQTAQIQTDNLTGDLERLKGSLETLAIENGSGANSGFRLLAQGAGALVDELGELPPVIGSTATVLAILGGATAVGAAGWVKMRRSNAEALEELRGTGPAGEKAANGLQSASKWAGRAAAAFIALEAAHAAASAFQSQLNPQVEALSQGLTKYAASGQLAGESARVLGADLGALDGQFQILADESGKFQWARGLQGALEGLIPGLDGTDTSLARTRERVTSLDGALAQLVQGGKAEEAKAAFERLGKQLAVNGVNLDEFKAQFPQYAAAIEVSAGATDDAATSADGLSSSLDGGTEAQKDYATAAEAAAAATRGERDALVQLSEHLRSETDPVFGFLDAQDKLAEAQDKVTKAQKEYGKGSTEAQKATRDLALAALELQGKTGELGESFDGEMTPALKATFKAAGLTDKEIGGLAKQFREAKKDGDKYAKKYEAEVGLTGYPGVEEKLSRLEAYQQALKKGMPTGFHGPVFVGGKGYHAGGWTGPGSKFQPAGVVHADEFVVQKESRQRFESQHPGALDHLNRTGELPGYASGGAVWPFKTSVAGTRIPSAAEAAAVVIPAAPGGGATGAWMKALLEDRFGVQMISGPRPGAVTLTGNASYHGASPYRAVDFAPIREMARFMYTNYKSRLREAITPFPEFNVHNGADHTYTGKVWAQHNWSGGNAHNHFAMKDGGVIPEHVFGIGKSGATYEFGEEGPETVIPGYASGGRVVGRPVPYGPSLVQVEPAETTRTITTREKFVPSGTKLDTAEAILDAKDAVAALSRELKENGKHWSSNTQKGRDNRNALINSVRAAQDAAEAKYRETGSVKSANKVYDEYLKKIDAQLKKQGLSKKQRQALLKQYGEKPVYDLPGTTTETITTTPARPKDSSGKVAQVSDQIAVEESLQNVKAGFAWTKPSFNVKTEAGRAELTTLFSYLSAAKQLAQSTFDQTGNVGSATRIYDSYVGELRSVLRASGMSAKEIDSLLNTYGKITLDTAESNRWGGVYHARSGRLRTAHIAGGGPTRYAYAEAETGGELFAPRLGNLAKTRAEVGWAVQNWWGGRVNWAPASSSAAAGSARSVTVQATIPITLGTEVITQQVRLEIDTAVGQIVDAVAYQSA
jgi:TP901 family phage tail tape measure protein